MAPEVLAGEPYGKLADVYSYGIVLWEIAALDYPWADLTGAFLTNQLLQAVQAGRRPPIDAAWPAAYVELMAACWQTSPALRPAFDVVLGSAYFKAFEA